MPVPCAGQRRLWQIKPEGRTADEPNRESLRIWRIPHAAGPGNASPAQRGAFPLRAELFGPALAPAFRRRLLLEVPRLGQVVCVRGPELNKRVFTAKANVLHGGDNPLGDVLGPGSLFSLDEGAHLAERRKLLPPFHGERMRSYEDLIEEEALREMDRWQTAEEFATIGSFNTITLRIILRAVFGAEGPELKELQAMLPGMTRLGQWMVAAPFSIATWDREDPGAKADRLRMRYREIVNTLVDKHLADHDLEQRIDILALMLRSDLENEVEVDRRAIADELLTLLVAGHETTASSLAWTVERVRRNPPCSAAWRRRRRRTAMPTGSR